MRCAMHGRIGFLFLLLSGAACRLMAQEPAPSRPDAAAPAITDPTASADPAAKPEPATKLDPAANANPAAHDDASETNDDEPPLREQTIYVPYDKLRETFEKTGRGVFIPYARFQELWNEARAQQRKPPEVAPPVPAVITEVASEATVGQEVVRVRAQLKIDVLARGWVEVPLRLADAGIISATLVAADGKLQPAHLATAADGGYKLLVENKGKRPLNLSLRLEYAKAFNKTPGRNDVSFAAPQAPINRWQVRIPESGAKVHVEPTIAATQTLSAEEVKQLDAQPTDKELIDKQPADKQPADEKTPAANPPDAKKAKSGETVLLAFVGAAPVVKIDWTAKAEGASGLSALASVEAQQVVRVEEGALRTHATLTYAVSRAELDKLTIEVPADQKVVSVLSANVRHWSVEQAGATQKITVELFEPARASEKIEVDLEQYFDEPAAKADPGDKAGAADKPGGGDKADSKPEGPANAKDQAKAGAPDKPQEEAGKPQADAPAKEKDAAKAEGPAGPKAEGPAARSVTVPIVRALDVARQQGILLVDAAEGLQVEVRTHDGLAQVDPADLPPNLTQARHQLSYRYAMLPERLVLDVTKIKPSIAATELLVAYLEPEQLTLHLQVGYTIERAGVFELALDVPEGFDIREVRGEPVAGGAPAQVDSHHLEGAGKTRLVVSLSHKALGKVGLFVSLEKRLDDANLLTPSGKTTDVLLSVPRTAPETLERTDGRLVVYAPESLRVNPGKVSGLRSVSLTEALGGVQLSSASQLLAQTSGRVVSSFVFTRAPAELTLQVERRKPQVTVAQLLVARVDPGVVRYEATFFYDIRYSGVKQLRIDLPAALAPEVRNASPGMTDKLLDPAPDDLAKGNVAWSFSGERELIGPVQIRLTWERRLENLQVGGSVHLDLPHLEPRHVDRAWGQLVLVKSETIDLTAGGKATGLRPIDPQHDLMPGASVPDAALAFEFHDDWSVDVTAARYQLEAVKHTSIERGLIRAVVTRGGRLAVQALYRLRSARQRLSVTLPAGTEFDNDPLRINGRPTPLERGAKDEFYVPLAGRSTMEPFLLELRYTLPGGQTDVELPAFADDAAVQKVFIVVFLPQERELIGYRGPWTDEQPWLDGSPLRVDCQPRHSDPELASWVRDEISLAANPADSFPVDGQPFVFSALRPENGPSGSLRLTTISHNWLNFLTFSAVLALGVLVLREPLARRLGALALLLVALVILGAFLPMTAVHILSGGFWLALVLVALVWLAAALLRSKARLSPAATGWHQARSAHAPRTDWSETPPATGPASEPSAPDVEAPIAGVPPETPPPTPPPAGESEQGGPAHD